MTEPKQSTRSRLDDAMAEASGLWRYHCIDCSAKDVTDEASRRCVRCGSFRTQERKE